MLTESLLKSRLRQKPGREENIPQTFCSRTPQRRSIVSIACYFLLFKWEFNIFPEFTVYTQIRQGTACFCPSGLCTMRLLHLKCAAKRVYTGAGGFFSAVFSSLFTLRFSLFTFTITYNLKTFPLRREEPDKGGLPFILWCRSCLRRQALRSCQRQSCRRAW